MLLQQKLEKKNTEQGSELKLTQREGGREGGERDGGWEGGEREREVEKVNLNRLKRKENILPYVHSNQIVLLFIQGKLD